MTALSRWLPFLNWPRPGAALLRNEFSAGLTVALVMVPQCVAYAGLTGMPLITGLYAGLLPLLVAVLFGGSTRLSVGPAALTCVLTAASLMGLAEPGGPQWVALAVWLAILSGVIQLALGAAGFAWMLNLVSAPVLLGFTQAAALLIMASQLPAFLGLQGPLSSVFDHPRLDQGALAFGAGQQCSEQAEGAVDMQPGAVCLAERGQCGQVVEITGVHLAGAGRDDAGRAGWQRRQCFGECLRINRGAARQAGQPP